MMSNNNASLLPLIAGFVLSCASSEPKATTPLPSAPASMPASAPAPLRPLIPRADLFGNPERAQGRFSPDGAYLSFIAPRDGVLNVWVQNNEAGAEAQPITSDSSRGIRVHFWAFDSQTVLYVQDKEGDENFRLYAVNVESGAERNLTPFEGVRAQVIGLSPQRPNVVIVGMNDRDPSWHDVYAVNLDSGVRKLVYKNVDELSGFVVDSRLRLRLATKSKPDGSNDVMKRRRGRWRRLLSIPFEDALTTDPLSITDSGDLLMRDSRGRDKSALFRVNLKTGAKELVAESEQADLGSVLTHPITKEPLAVAENYLRSKWKVLDPSVQADLDFLEEKLSGDFQLTSSTLDLKRWMIVEFDSDAPSRYSTYDREAKTLTKLFTTRPALAEAKLAPMKPVVIKSRDGLDLVSYLTLPRDADPDGDGRPDTPLPMVLNVHGGPWGRNSYGLSNESQWFADRGYATLQVNFRGSTGFGKAFTSAGDLEWGRKMHDDLLDAVAWAVAEGVTKSEMVAIYGGSYGGYATLAGLSFTPEVFACGVDIVGPSNLLTLLSTIPPYWKAFFEQLAKRVGDPRTEEGRALLKERSPLTHAGQIVRPLLIAQGANDPRVKQAESDQIVAAMKEKSIPVIYALFPDEGHGFARPSNRLAFYSVTEAFLAECLGGRAEPIGSAFEGSSITFPAGADALPALQDALQP